MHRKEFIKTCGFACMALAASAIPLDGCTPSRYVLAATDGNYLVVPASEFIITREDRTSYRKYIIVRNDKLGFPVFLSRENETAYTALLLKCTHQAAELSVNGDMLSCYAHGSEFTTHGEVITGPADTPLTAFPVSLENSNIKIKIS